MTPDDVKVSTHALKRYRDRFNTKATAEDVAVAVAAAQPAPNWIRRLGDYTDEHALLVNGQAVFVTLLPAPGGSKSFVVTCFPLSWCETSRKSFGKKRLKKKFNLPRHIKGAM